MDRQEVQDKVVEIIGKVPQQRWSSGRAHGSARLTTPSSATAEGGAACARPQATGRRWWEAQALTPGDYERDELAAIYVAQGLDSELAREVATQLMARDALAAHARDELGISETLTARPLQAAVASAATFAAGAAMPLLSAVVSPVSSIVPVVSGSSLIFLALLGALAARTGGAPILRSAFRVTFWGAVAMGLTAGVGAVFGTAA